MFVGAVEREESAQLDERRGVGGDAEVDLAPAPGAGAELRPDGRRIVPRTLILAAEGGAIAAPVDEVEGIQAVPEAALLPAAEAARPIGRYAAGVLRRQGRSITLLDDAAFLRALAGSLA